MTVGDMVFPWAERGVMEGCPYCGTDDGPEGLVFKERLASREIGI